MQDKGRFACGFSLNVSLCTRRPCGHGPYVGPCADGPCGSQRRCSDLPDWGTALLAHGGCPGSRRRCYSSGSNGASWPCRARENYKRCRLLVRSRTAASLHRRDGFDLHRPLVPRRPHSRVSPARPDASTASCPHKGAGSARCAKPDRPRRRPTRLWHRLAGQSGFLPSSESRRIR